MHVTAILHKEKTIADIIDRLYINQTDGSRKTAEAQLLKLNPVLSNSNAIRPGVIIKVPEIPKLTLNHKQIGDDPIAQTKGILEEAIESYKEQLIGRFITLQQDLNDQIKLLNNVKREIVALDNSGELHKRIETLEALVKTRGISTEEFRKKLDDNMFDKILADLPK